MKKQNKSFLTFIALFLSVIAVALFLYSTVEARVSSHRSKSSKTDTGVKSSISTNDKSTPGASSVAVVPPIAAPKSSKASPNSTDKQKTITPPSPLDNVAATKATLLSAESYRYNPAGKTDPFKPFMETDPTALLGKAKMKLLPLSPLQRLDVDQFTLVGIAGTNKRRAAMVEDKKDKKFYPVFIGTSIGLNHGKVVNILSDRVIVDEKITVARNMTKAKRTILMLHKENEVKP